MKPISYSNLTTAICCLTSILAINSITNAQQSFNSLSEKNDRADLFIADTSNIDAFDIGVSRSIQTVRYQEIVAATKEFLALLDLEQRNAVMLDFEHPYRTRSFCYVLAQCKEDNVGLRISQLNAKQKIALNNLLMKSYSSAGYSRAIQTMNREGLIEEMENAHRADTTRYPVIGSPQVPNWSPPPYRKGSDFYIAIFGEPDATKDFFTAQPWGVRFEGHHLSLNLTFNGYTEQPRISVMPMFFGSSPMIVPQSPASEEGVYTRWQTEEGQQLLHREAWLARSFLQSLDEELVAQGAWSALPHAELKGGTDVPLDADSYLENEKPGILVSQLNPLQQRLLWEFVNEFWQMQANPEISQYALKKSLAQSRVWWYGDRNDEHGELYLRIQSDRYLVELLQSNTFGVTSSDVEANHVHASFRDLQNDWDRDFLSDHLNRHHNF